MTEMRVSRVLLGPQSPVRTIGEAVARAQLPDGPLAVISAGWQEAEGDLDELGQLVGRPLQDLSLYRRAEDLTQTDPAFASAIRERQELLIEQQRLYRVRLRSLSVAARNMLSADGNPDAVAAEQRHAIAQLRALDRHHQNRCESLWQGFLATHGPAANAALARHAAEIADTLERCVGVIITGGNVAVLINRMRLFDLESRLQGCNVIAWSAGAMVLAGRIVLFHDRSPEGRRDAEVLGTGCGVLPGYVFLPDANRRLRTADRVRIGLLCRRFAPETCLTLNNQAELHLDSTGAIRASGVRRLGRDGRLVKLQGT